MAAKKARGKALHDLEECASRLDRVLKAARVNERDLKLKLAELKGKRILANDLNDDYLYEEKDEEVRNEAREEAQRIVEPAEAIMFSAEEVLEKINTPETEEVIAPVKTSVQQLQNIARSRVNASMVALQERIKSITRELI